MTATYIFNQYYIDFLKRIKDIAKKNKETSSTAKAVLKSIKENYLTLDKASDEYLIYLKENISEEAWNKFLESDNWIQEHGEIEIYKNIKLSDIDKLLQDDYLCYHFISVFYIFKNELSDDVSSKIVKILQTIDTKDLIEELEDENIKKVLNKLQELRNKKIKDKSGIDMNFIEDTTLGKLAKEILEDIDVNKLQKSMSENGDVLKAIGDPDSGFADIITNVSKKMATKISSGELKQENLIQDAMKFASIMPNIFGGPASSRNSDSKSGADLSNIMEMMSSMMGNNSDLSNMFKDMNMPRNIPRAQKGTKMAVNESALKKIAKAKKLKKKLQEKKRTAASSEAAANTDSNE